MNILKLIITFENSAFNKLARIYRHYSDPTSVITIDFHDRKLRPLKFEDSKQLYLSCLSDDGAFFGCDGELANTSSFLEFKAFESNVDMLDWSVELCNGENVKGW